MPSTQAIAMGAVGAAVIGVTAYQKAQEYQASRMAKEATDEKEREQQRVDERQSRYFERLFEEHEQGFSNDEGNAAFKMVERKERVFYDLFFEQLVEELAAGAPGLQHLFQRSPPHGVSLCVASVLGVKDVFMSALHKAGANVAQEAKAGAGVHLRLGLASMQVSSQSARIVAMFLNRIRTRGISALVDNLRRHILNGGGGDGHSGDGGRAEVKVELACARQAASFVRGGNSNVGIHLARTLHQMVLKKSKGGESYDRDGPKLTFVPLGDADILLTHVERLALVRALEAAGYFVAFVPEANVRRDWEKDLQADFQLKPWKDKSARGHGIPVFGMETYHGSDMLLALRLGYGERQKPRWSKTMDCFQRELEGEYNYSSSPMLGLVNAFQSELKCLWGTFHRTHGWATTSETSVMITQLNNPADKLAVLLKLFHAYDNTWSELERWKLHTASSDANRNDRNTLFRMHLGLRKLQKCVHARPQFFPNGAGSLLETRHKQCYVPAYTLVMPRRGGRSKLPQKGWRLLVANFDASEGGGCESLREMGMQGEDYARTSKGRTVGYQRSAIWRMLSGETDFAKMVECAAVRGLNAKTGEWKKSGNHPQDQLTIIATSHEQKTFLVRVLVHIRLRFESGELLKRLGLPLEDPIGEDGDDSDDDACGGSERESDSTRNNKKTKKKKTYAPLPHFPATGVAAPQFVGSTLEHCCAAGGSLLTATQVLQFVDTLRGQHFVLLENPEDLNRLKENLRNDLRSSVAPPQPGEKVRYADTEGREGVTEVRGWWKTPTTKKQCEALHEKEVHVFVDNYIYVRASPA